MDDFNMPYGTKYGGETYNNIEYLEDFIEQECIASYWELACKIRHRFCRYFMHGDKNAVEWDRLRATLADHPQHFRAIFDSMQKDSPEELI